MTSKRREKRIREVGEEHADHVILKSAEELLVSKPVEDLFVIDTLGSASKRRKLLKETNANQLSVVKITSKTDKALLKKMQQNPKKQITTVAIENNVLGDIWANDLLPETSKVQPKRQSIKTITPIPGQSYNPTKKDHQEALTVAVTLENARLAKDKLEKGEMDTSLSEFTQSFLVSEDAVLSESEQSDDESENEDRRNGRKFRIKTRAERNKHRLSKDANYELHKEKAAKRLLKQINNLPILLKDIQKQEVIRSNMEQTMHENALEQKKHETAVRNMSYNNSKNIPLSDEISHSLRHLKPKQGCLLVEEVDKLTAANEMMQFQRRKRRGGEKNPFAGKNLNWIPKYKYV